jgi:hypothetical protein
VQLTWVLRLVGVSEKGNAPPASVGRPTQIQCPLPQLTAFTLVHNPIFPSIFLPSAADLPVLARGGSVPPFPLFFYTFATPQSRSFEITACGVLEDVVGLHYDFNVSYFFSSSQNSPFRRLILFPIP